MIYKASVPRIGKLSNQILLDLVAFSELSGNESLG